MTFALTLIGVGVTTMAAAVTYLAWRNGKITKENTERILKAMNENTEKILNAMKEDFKFIALLILAETQEEKKSIARKILNI